MSKPMFDVDALIAQFESATAQQGAQLRKATTEATMAALQGRELTLKNIRGALKQVAEAASTGVAKNMTANIDPESLLDQAVAGMDAAMLKAVEANRVALSTLATQGADLREKHLSKALSDLEKMEDTLFAAVKKGLFFRGVGELPFGTQIRSVRELIERLLTPALPQPA